MLLYINCALNDLFLPSDHISTPAFCYRHYIEQKVIRFIVQVQLVDKGSVVDGTIPWILVLPYYSQLVT